ncbi:MULTISPECIES: hypothetical protein [unclassified Prochlorococcus]|uniref:hypothetical protein n=1 Tax=unclassified Prochlorococcus TaxID=2627481 RepID=UPI00053375AB|nr:MULTISPECIES: hypothetical protein [unclassified Prochlorococcus]KGG16317.1 hypothetical protein EV07_1486 [Prochlorococcus sp. MIT 0603]KGG17949.1 hypothetical protein EV06_0072 [Prochlorococcus sp. MIT 0602]
MKALIIGTGSIAQRHSNILQSKGIHCIHLSRTRKHHGTIKNLIFLSYMDFLPKKYHNYFDLSVIAGSPENRKVDLEISYIATRDNSLIAVEKPLLSWNEYDINILDKFRKRKFYTLFNVRYNPNVQKIKDIIEDSYSEIQSIKLFFHDNPFNWYGERSLTNYVIDPDHGGALNISCHEIDLLLYITKTSQDDWFILNKKELLNPKSSKIEDSIEINLIHSKSEIKAFISLSLVSPIRKRFIELIKTNNKIPYIFNLDNFEDFESWSNTYESMWDEILKGGKQITARGSDGIVIARFCKRIKEWL